MFILPDGNKFAPLMRVFRTRIKLPFAKAFEIF